LEVDLAWRDGRLDEAKVRSTPGGVCKVRWGEQVVELKPGKGEEVVLDGKLGRR
jgi:hypothetical protein